MSIVIRIAVGLLVVALPACTSDPVPTAPVTSSSVSPTTDPPGAWALVGGGWSFGECAGSCVAAVAFSGDGSTTLTLADRMGDGSRTYEGQLTSLGLEQLAAAGRDEVGTIDRRYGCPDCTDGGASQLTWADGESRFTTTYEYGSPPPALQDQDRFVRQVIETLWGCDRDRYVRSSRPFAGCRR